MRPQIHMTEWHFYPSTILTFFCWTIEISWQMTPKDLIFILLTRMKLFHIIVMWIIFARYEMNSLKKLKMEKVKNLLSSKEDVNKVRSSLEQKTAQAFIDFAKSRQKVQEMAHLKYLDWISKLFRLSSPVSSASWYAIWENCMGLCLIHSIL